MKNKRIEPQGEKIIVLETPKKAHETESGLTVIESQLTEGVVVEISKQFEGVYKKGDVVVFPEKAGVNVFYKGTAHLYLNGTGAPMGDVWAIITEDGK